MRRKALSSPEDSARLRMLAYSLKVHHVRFVVYLDALRSTQAWQRRFLRASIFILHFDFSLRDSFQQNLT